MHLLRWSALAILVSGCHSITIKPGSSESFGLESHVRAGTDDDAERVAQQMERLVPRIRALKGVPKPAPLVVVAEEHLPGVIEGMQFPNLILLGPAPGARQRLTLAHELSHWFRNSTWNRLPDLVEEGLAEHVAALVLPVEASRHFQSYLFQTPDVVDLDAFRHACAVELDDTIDHSIEEEIRLRAIGYVVASDLGISQLRNLCERAERAGLSQIPADWIYEALSLHHIAGGSWKAAHNRRMNAIDAEADRVRAQAK